MARIAPDIIPLAGSCLTVGPDGPEYQPFPVGPSLPEASTCDDCVSLFAKFDIHVEA
jgi:hypothetical protein